MNGEFPCTDGFDSMRGYMEKCVVNEMCEFPVGILDELEAGLGVAGTEPKGTTTVHDDSSCVQDDTVKVSPSEHDNNKARDVDKSRDGIGSIPTPSKTKETRKRRNDGNDINKKPSQRPRVKKHRPKIYDDSKPKKVPKVQTPRATPKSKTPKPSTPNRVQERRMQSRNSTNCTLKSTSFGVEHVGQDVQEASRAIVVRSCKRFLDFDHHSVVKESKSHEQPLTLGFDFEKFDCFRGKIVTSKRNTPRRSKFQNKCPKASDNLVIDNNGQHVQDICITRNQEQVDKYGRKYVHFYHRRKKSSSNSTSLVSTTPTLLKMRACFSKIVQEI
ncbi:uncharacterized protein LOC143589252 [Bidens hawaiensis]|uniref:uncharacterized protein LOC143589252 n=1 Tax=Bidens hawaiensis TaxID=980011 RepID=UPI00404A4F51